MTAVLIVAIYPDYAKAGNELNELLNNPAIKAFVGEGVDLTTPEGFLTMEGYNLFFPVLIIIFAIMLGTAFISGEEKDGTLELLITTPISRHSIIIQKFLSLVTLTTFLGFIFLKERPTLKQWVAVFLATAAVITQFIAYGSLPWIALTIAFSLILNLLSIPRKPCLFDK